MAEILKMMGSSYHPTIKIIVESVSDGKIGQKQPVKYLMHSIMWLPIHYHALFLSQSKVLKEAQDINLHLQPLNALLSQLEMEEFPQYEKFIPALFHTLFLIWTNCTSYQRPRRILVLLQELCSLLIEQVQTII